MSPFWAQLPARYEDDRGTAEARFEDAPREVSESYLFHLRGNVLPTDGLDEIFETLPANARMTWRMTIDLVDASLARIAQAPLVIEARTEASATRQHMALRAHAGLADRSVFSRWHLGWSGGFEDALSDLRAALSPGLALHTCYFCKWSDYEPSTTTGHLGCFRAVKAEYEAIATSPDNWTRKYKPDGLSTERVWVDELNACDEFALRPKGFGYRG